MEVKPIGGLGGPGQDPPSMLMFLHYAVSNNAAPLCAVPIHSTIFLVCSSSLGQVPRSDPTHEMAILGRSACGVCVGRPVIAGNYWMRMHGKMVLLGTGWRASHMGVPRCVTTACNT